MKQLENHPIAQVLPLIEGDEFAKLVASIRAQGLLEPIILFEDKILDGRNRYRACLEAGVDVRTEQFSGPDPIGFAIAKNVHRRQLTPSQRSLVMAKYIALQPAPGEFEHMDGTGANHVVSDGDAAKVAMVSERTLRDAKLVLAEGSAEEIADANNGKIAVKPLANTIRTRAGRQHHRQPPQRRASFPADGRKFSEHVREGLAIERSKRISRKPVSIEIKMPFKTYCIGREIIMLLDNPAVPSSDHKICERALDLLDRGLIASAHRLIADIGTRMWSGGKDGRKRIYRTDAAVKRQNDQFHKYMAMVCASCEQGEHITFPQLPPDKINIYLKDLIEARRGLLMLMNRLKEQEQKHAPQKD